MRKTRLEHAQSRAAVPRGRIPGALRGVCVALLSVLLPAGAFAQQPPGQRSIEDEVVADILSQRSGYGTLANLNYPEAYVRRLADRVLRASFERSFRAVIHNPDDGPEPEGPPAPPGIRSSSRPATTPVLPEFIRFVPASISATAADPLADLSPEQIPIGFRARVFDTGSGGAARAALPRPTDEKWRSAAEKIAGSLAKAGLLPTLVLAIEAVGPDEFLPPRPASGDDCVDRLAGAGFPVDWLECFRTPDGARPISPVDIARRLKERGRAATLAYLDQCRFEYRPAIPGFRSVRDDGGDEIGLLRLQMSRGGDWIGRGDGGAVDIGRQLATALPKTPFFVSIARDELDEFKLNLADWTHGRTASIDVAVEPFEIAQWAQDNARNGRIDAGADVGQAATLVPRFASRGEIGALYAPGETFLMRSFAAAGHRCMQSRLLFQGGDMIFVHDPARREFVLLLGEAEVSRNCALGLTRAQVLAAYRAEFGADRCVVLPTISFHIDYEVTLRVVDGRLIAFVNDPLAAAKVIGRTALGTLARLGLLSDSNAATSRAYLDAGRYGDFANLVGEILISQAIGAGVYDEKLAEKFSSGASGESGVANFQSILLALDILVNASMADDQVPDDRPGGYIRAWRRYLADLAVFRKALEAEGWKVVPVPSISDGARSLNYLNGVQTPQRYFMPAIGGLLKPLDDAAAAAFRAELGPAVEVAPILSSETQRRQGALRCAVSAVPAPSVAASRPAGLK